MDEKQNKTVPTVTAEQKDAPEKAEGKGAKKGSPRLKRVIFLLVALVLVIVITNPASIWFLPDGAKGTLSEVWFRLFGDVNAITDTVRINWISIFQIIVIVLFMALIVNVVRFVLEKIKDKISGENKDEVKEDIKAESGEKDEKNNTAEPEKKSKKKLSPENGRTLSILSLVDSYIVYAAVLVGLVWSLSAIGINLSTIFASLGIVALIIGFAAESLIADIITGLFLVFEGEFNVGDIIEFNGFRGTVESIGVRVTTIRDVGGNLKIVNNSDIRDVLNRSKLTSKAVCDIPVSYRENLEEVEKILDKILATLPEKNPEIFKAPPERKGVQELAASAVILRVCAEVPETKLFDAIRTINREVKVGFDKAGVEIPFQQVVIHQAED